MERVRRAPRKPTKKRGPGEELNQKQKNLVELYCNLPHRQSSRYIAYIEAGYTGGKQSCDKLFESKKISSAINKRKQEVGERVREIQETSNSSLTEFTIQALENFLEKGITNKKACKLAGIDYSTYTRWMKKGRDALENNDRAKQEYIDVFHRLSSARYRGEQYLLACIIKSGTEGHEWTETKVKRKMVGGVETEIEETTITKRSAPQWQANAWVLEKTRRDVYGRDSMPIEDENYTQEDQAKDDADLLKYLLGVIPESMPETKDNQSIDTEETKNESV